MILFLKSQYNEVKRLMEYSKDKAKQCLDDAQRLSGVTNQYDSYPNDLGEIEERIHEYQTRAELSCSIDTGVRHHLHHLLLISYSSCFGPFSF